MEEAFEEERHCGDCCGVWTVLDWCLSFRDWIEKCVVCVRSMSWCLLYPRIEKLFTANFWGSKSSPMWLC